MINYLTVGHLLQIEDRIGALLENMPHSASETWTAYSWPLARRESPRVMMDRLLMSVVTVLDRIMAKCGLQSPHLVSPHCFIAVGILNTENIK